MLHQCPQCEIFFPCQYDDCKCYRFQPLRWELCSKCNEEYARSSSQEPPDEGRIEDIQEALPKTGSTEVMILDEAYILFPRKHQDIFERFFKRQ